MSSPFDGTDTYTEYELLEPGSAQFRVTYFVTELEEGATLHLNGTRPGSEETDLSAEDVATGAPIGASLVTGAELAAEGAGEGLDPEALFSRMELARPVGAGGEARVRVNKTYRDPLSYWVEDDGSLVFKRSLGIQRNAVVLPLGYALASSSVQAEVMQLPSGQVKLSFINYHGYASDVNVVATPIAEPLPPLPASEACVEAAYDNTEALYDLADEVGYRIVADVDITRHSADLTQRPATHFPFGELDSSNRLRLSALLSRGWLAPATLEALTFRSLDSGERLEVEQTAEGSAIGPLDPQGRLRLSATVTDADNYRTGDVGELVFSREFSAARTTVLLPAGYTLARATVPVRAGTDERGRSWACAITPCAAHTPAPPRLRLRCCCAGTGWAPRKVRLCTPRSTQCAWAAGFRISCASLPVCGHSLHLFTACRGRSPPRSGCGPSRRRRPTDTRRGTVHSHDPAAAGSPARRRPPPTKRRRWQPPTPDACRGPR